MSACFNRCLQALLPVRRDMFHGQAVWGLSLPILVLVVGMAGIFHHEQQRQIREIADIDIAVLSDELPPSAYADNGFRAYIVDRTGV